MPTPQQTAQNQAISPMDFDPDEIMKEIVQREAQVTLKEQELAQIQQQLQGQMQPPVDGAQVEQQTQEDISQSAQQALASGNQVSLTKKLVMTEQGPQEISRQEKIHQQGVKK